MAVLKGRHDTQCNDIQHDATQPNNTQHKGIICDIQHNDTAVMLNVIMLSVAFYLLLYRTECHYAECRHAECRGAKRNIMFYCKGWYDV